ncbi:saccharopine dehydrogenase NADP-binding domain-containing protein [Neobittarella massiliensis]|uniref:Saccharopine dehydrogenase NADP-binding domain-containing protein n=1 Tax=Neobittarella massiliensis (ex Bilen et al. 2018) TaxID=2041842 RepID=A0A8J6INA6_9FIRM|nr:saccharopine dehydrogenase C-terminal domain-containing protein [Neobittarella massiliensis]MBC3515830.1 saccharopine dehydrogenase NADP-binding domain-containing protein [Neobittarella massiliensis]
MKMMLVGAGAVGECILKVMQTRDREGHWFTGALVCDIDIARARQVVARLPFPERCTVAALDARSTQAIADLAQAHQIDLIMDAAAPFVADNIFDAAFLAGADYANMGTWSIPSQRPAYGPGIENSYDRPMTAYNFSRHEEWQQRGRMACICLGIDPGVVNVFARYAAQYLFDTLEEVHVKDGGDLSIPGAGPDQIAFGFNVWTVLDECMNPNVEYDRDRGGLIVEPALTGGETFVMPDGIGPNHLVKVEHEEVVTMPRYLARYGLKRATFKIALDPNLITALKTLDALGLRSLKPVDVGGVQVVPRDVVAACAPQPRDIGREMTGSMCVGVHCIGQKDGRRKEVFLYQTYENTRAMADWDMQAVVAQTGFGAALALELIATGVWRDSGVFSPEYFDPLPYLALMDQAGFDWHCVELTPQQL